MTTTNEAPSEASEILELITGAFREALGDPELTSDSDFFEAGGDSLSAFAISARLHETLGVEGAMALVFIYPTPAELASAVAPDLVQG
jgi:acyl carrier protein